MKLRNILLILFTITVAFVVFGGPVFPYDKSKAPGLALPAAYNYALSALKDDTNHFHCVSAIVETSLSKEGAWQFTFYSINSKPKWVTVEFNGKTHVENIMVR